MHAELLRAPVADVRITHHGEEVIFDLKYFERKTGQIFGAEDSEVIIEPFEDINRYWAMLSEEKQSEIFRIYRYIKETMLTVFDLRSLQQTMTQLTTELMNYHQYSDIDHFMRFNSFINIPSDISETFEPDNSVIIGTREQTYIKEDYRQLAVLSVALRPLGIFIGEYINNIEGAVDTTWKELTAFYLILKSWIPESEPFKRFEVYINANVDAKIYEVGISGFAPAIMAGIGIEDYPMWLMSLTILKRVVFADIKAGDEKRSIIQSIYGFIQTKLTNPSSSFKDRINKKDIESDVGGEEGKLSLFESYKAKIITPLGEIALIEHFLENPIKLATDAQPEIDIEVVNDFLMSSEVLLEQRIGHAQINIMQWVLSNVVPIRIVPHLEKHYVVKALAVTGAVLWHRGFKSLAGLTTAYMTARNEMVVRPSSDTTRIPRELTERMESYYPYSRRPTGKAPKKKTNPATQAITNMARRLTRNDWTFTIADKYSDQIVGLRPNKQYSAMSDLRLNLIELVIDLNERTKNELPSTVSFED